MSGPVARNVTLPSDFCLRDPYGAEVKAALLRQGLRFPVGSVHLAVVDPGLVIGRADS